MAQLNLKMRGTQYFVTRTIYLICGRGCGAVSGPQRGAPAWSRCPNRFPTPTGEQLAALLSLLGAQSRGALAQIGKEKVHDCFLVNGDIGCCHGSAQTFIPRRGLGAPAQAEPVPGRKTINCVDAVSLAGVYLAVSPRLRSARPA